MPESVPNDHSEGITPRLPSIGEDHRYRVLAESAPDAILTVDDQNIILSVNAATERIFGWRADEMLGRSLDMIIPQRLRAGHAHGMSRYLRTGRRHISWTGVPVLACTKSGREIPIEISFGEFEHEGRHIFSGFLRDVSEREAQRIALERTTEELHRTLAALEERVREAEAARRAADEANEAKSRFLATMSHELRTPLNAIGGYLQLMELGLRGPVTDEQRADLARMHAAEQRLLALINDVLDFAKIESGHQRFSIRDVDVGAVLCSLGPIVEPQLSARRIEYRCDAGEGDLGPIATADRDKLEQVLLNLMSNALKFTPSGGRIHLWSEERDDGVDLHVRDTGIGIPADRLDAVFEPFVQVESGLTRRHEGTGLGLAISRQLVEGMGGRLTVSSTPGEGSVFTISLLGGGSRFVHSRRPPLGERLSHESQAVVAAVCARLRADASLPAGVSDAAIEDHLASLFTDLAQTVSIVQDAPAEAPLIMGDGTRIQQLIVALHAEQRARLGWPEALMVRELDWITAELLAALQRTAHADEAERVETAAGLLRSQLERRRQEALEHFRQLAGQEPEKG